MHYRQFAFEPVLEPRQTVWQSEGIKSYAICPYFTDTALIRNLMTQEERMEAEKNIPMGFLKPKDVSTSLIRSLEDDDNGSAYLVVPQLPLLKFPSNDNFLVNFAIIFAKIFFLPKTTVIDVRRTVLVVVLFALGLAFLLGCLLTIIIS